MVGPLRGERPELLELTEADDGLPTVTALCDALRLGRAPPGAAADAGGWGAAAALDAPWHYCGFSQRDHAACSDPGCRCRATLADAARQSRGSGPAAAAHALTWLVRALHGRLLRIGCGARAAAEPRTTQRAADADDALACRLRLLQLAPAADALAVALATASPEAEAALAARVAAPPRRPAAHPLNLPDITAIVSHLNYDCESSVIVGSGLARLLSKLVPCRCLFRGFSAAVTAECESSEPTAALLIRTVHTSLAGAIPWTDRPAIEPPFAAAMVLECGALSVAPCDTAAFVRWAKLYPHVVFYCLKEALCFYVSLAPGLRECLTQTGDGWSCFEKGVHRTCEGVRALCGASGWAVGLPLAEAQLVKQTGATTYAHKLYKHSFDATVVRACKLVASEPLPPAAQGALDADVDCVAFVAARLSAVGLARKRSSLVRLIGCSPQACALADELLREFRAVGFTPAQLRGRLVGAAADDIWRLRTLSGMLDDLSATESVAIDSRTTDMQVAALCARTGHAAPQDLHSSDGCVYFCWDCGSRGRKWRTPEEHAHNLHGIGAHESYVDLTDTLRCNRKNRTSDSCDGARLVRVSLVGRWFKHTGAWYTLCPLCAAPTSYDMRRAVAGGSFSCGRCLEESVRIVQKEAKLQLAERARTAQFDWSRGANSCWFCCAKLAADADTADRVLMRVQRDLPGQGTCDVTLCTRCAFTRASRLSPPVSRLGLTEAKLLAFLRRHSRVMYR